MRPANFSWYLVHLSRLHPHLGQVASGKECGAASNGKEPLRPSAGGQNAQWGVRDIAEVTDLAHRHGFSLAETVPMPANNLSVIFERGP